LWRGFQSAASNIRLQVAVNGKRRPFIGRLPFPTVRDSTVLRQKVNCRAVGFDCRRAIVIGGRLHFQVVSRLRQQPRRTLKVFVWWGWTDAIRWRWWRGRRGRRVLDPALAQRREKNIGRNNIRTISVRRARQLVLHIRVEFRPPKANSTGHVRRGRGVIAVDARGRARHCNVLRGRYRTLVVRNRRQATCVLEEGVPECVLLLTACCQEEHTRADGRKRVVALDQPNSCGGDSYKNVNKRRVLCQRARDSPCMAISLRPSTKLEHSCIVTFDSRAISSSVPKTAEEPSSATVWYDESRG